MDQSPSFPRYDSYKDSGADWLGAIPMNWTVLPFKALFQMSAEKNGKTIIGEMLSVSGYRGIEVKRYEHEEQKRLAKDLVDYRVVRKGELVVNTMWLNYAGLGVSGHEGHVSPAYRSYRISNQLHGRYVHYLMRSHVYVDGYTGQMQGIRPNSLQIKNCDFNKFPILLPKMDEQQRIANFLDQKTAEIDAAIAKKHRLIELLKEQKAILINQAVTKGLNPDVPMRDSGVEWIGEVPEHWKVKRLRYVGTTQNGISAGANYFGSGFPFVSYSDVYKNRELPRKVNGLAKSSKQDRVQYSIEKGDVLFTRTSETAEEIGFTSTCMETIENSTFAGFLIRFRPLAGHLSPGYSKYYFNAQMHRSYFVGEINLVIRASLSQELLKKLPVLIPPKTEQESIFEYLEAESTTYDNAMALQQQQIDKLKEFKAILVSEAVTGKIKL